MLEARVRSSVALVSLFIFAMTWADFSQSEIKTYRLELKENDQFPTAKFSGVEGIVGQEPHRYLVDKLSILQPVNIALRTLDPDNDIELTIHKYRWDEPERLLTTNENGIAIARFRTQGEFQFQLRASRDNASYQLLVMVGDEVLPVMPRVVLSEAEFMDWKSSSRGTSIGVEWSTVVIVLLLGAILFVAFRIYQHLRKNQ